MSIALPGKPKGQALVVGGVPRAELLPPELKQEAVARSVRRALGGVIVIVLLVVVASYVLATLVAEGSKARLASANESTTLLLNEQGKYIEVRQLAAQVKASEEARKIGMATHIDWTAFLTEAVLRVGATGSKVTQFVVDATTPLSALPPGTLALEGPRQAELTFEGVSPTLVPLADWLKSFKDLPGFVDLRINSVKLEGAQYVFNMTVHVDEGAFSYDYVDNPNGEEAEADAEADPDAGADSETESTDEEAAE